MDFSMLDFETLYKCTHNDYQLSNRYQFQAHAVANPESLFPSSPFDNGHGYGNISWHLPGSIEDLMGELNLNDDASMNFDSQVGYHDHAHSDSFTIYEHSQISTANADASFSSAMADTTFSLASRIEQMDDGMIVCGVLGPYIADIPQPRLSRRELNAIVKEMCYKLVGVDPFKVKHFQKNGSSYFVKGYRLPDTAKPGNMLRYNAKGDRLYNPDWRQTAKHNNDYITAVVAAVENIQGMEFSSAYIYDMVVTYFCMMCKTYMTQIQATTTGAENVVVDLKWLQLRKLQDKKFCAKLTTL